jgi:O-methyltransferase involved in polyketide biosynthesis
VRDPEFEVDFSRPSGARIYDYLQGGKDNFAPDREAADAIEAMFPGMSGLVRQHREFARRAARWLHDEGVSQFIDVGCGLPSRPMVAETVPCARTAYVASDPVVLAHLRALAAGPGIAVVAGDEADPGQVLASPELAEVIDLQQPVGVLLAGILSGMPPETAQRAVRGYSAALAPGSAVAISCVSYADQEAGDEAAAAYEAMTGGTYCSHSRAAIEGFFTAAGLHLESPVGNVRAWWEPVSMAERPVSVLGGVGIVPLPSRRRKRP